MWKEVSSMKQYERPEILATYTVEELVAEAEVCATYGGSSGGGGGGGGGGGVCDPVTDPTCGS